MAERKQQRNTLSLDRKPGEVMEVDCCFMDSCKFVVIASELSLHVKSVSF